MKLALVGPVPPVRSGIAEFHSRLIAALAARAEVSLLVDGVRPADDWGAAGVVEVGDLRRPQAMAIADRADAVLVQLGNDPLHVGAYEFLLERRRRGRPAVLELHELALGHFAAALWFETGKVERYLEEARLGHGAEGERIAREEVLGKRLGLWDLDPLRLPMSGRAIRAAAGVIAHSRFVRRGIWGIAPEAAVAVIPHFTIPAAERSNRAAARSRLDVPLDRFVISSTGFATPAKRLDAVVEALAAWREVPNWEFRIAGEAAVRESIGRLAAERGILDRLVFTGYLERAAFVAELAATDALVNLREPTFGESSGNVAGVLALGVPTLVSDVGWYGELPDDIVIKIPPGESAVDRLRVELARLRDDPERRRALAARATAFAQAHWGLDEIAEQYLEALPRLSRGPSAGDQLLADFALAAASLGDRDGRYLDGLAVEFAVGP